MANNKDVLNYKIKTASADDIFIHLSECKDDFIPALDQRVNIKDYAQKIATNCITFEGWEDHALVGLIAAYFNDVNHLCGFITSISVFKNYHGHGIGSILLNNCINYANDNKFKELSLKVNKLSAGAIKLYKKYNFSKCDVEGDFYVMHLALTH